MSALFELGPEPAIPVEIIDPAHRETALRRLSAAQRRWLEQSGFTAAAGQHALLADAHGALSRVLVAMADPSNSLQALASLPYSLPEGQYRIAAAPPASDPVQLALGWALAAYRFERYRKAPRRPAQLGVDAAVLEQVLPLATATGMVRDLVNTPAEHMGPKQLAEAVKQLAKAHKARIKEWVGDELLSDNFPTIHAVGRASHRSPRLIELNWGKASHPGLVLVGKGVCFDTGGLDLKPSSGMRWMKKDMGGAAHAIALAELVMQAKLPVRLSLLIPAVENAVSGPAMRPGDIITTRAGITVEVDNTDAEGRLVLCDALAYGAERKPELMIDFATLTGAARVALGPELPALFGNHTASTQALQSAGDRQHDPVWPLPLWQPYMRMLDSSFADISNCAQGGHAGAITAALYLQRFVPADIDWLHLDTYAWNDADRPGRPRGGEAMGLRASFAYLQQRFGRRHGEAATEPASQGGA
ncbi:leucyl aminopeptidase family protein [Frateuria aurantia]